MTKHVLFIHGAGTGAYKADAILVQRLQAELGPDYEVIYPQLPDEDNAPYETWKKRIQEELTSADGPMILVGHSIGASHLVKMIGEGSLKTSIKGVVLLEAPFWGGEGWLYEGYKELVVSSDAASHFPHEAKVFLYHTRDDEIVPFEHVELYARLLPQAVVREISSGGHQLYDDLSLITKDIRDM